MYHALREWVFPNHPEKTDLVPSLVESCVISHYQRFYPCYYIKAEGEVDLAYVDKDQFFPIEVKWRKQLRSKDIKQISKYKKNALILNQTFHNSTLNDIPTLFLPEHLCNSYIREKLDQFSNNKGLRWATTQEEQVKIIEKLLTKSLPYELPDHLTKLRYAINCFAYALGLDNSEVYVDISRDESINCFASPDFITYLLQEKILKEIESAYEGCLIIYFDTKTPKHAGIMHSVEQPYIVKSKWGSFQKIFYHKIWDVPKSYGDSIVYYDPSDWEKIEACFLNYISRL